MKTCVVIPTYNESNSIADLVNQIKKQGLEAVVIDDGSLDNTSDIALSNGATVIRNNRNEGKGASLIRGFDHALTNAFDAIITMDGDGQHLPGEIPIFLKVAANSKSNVLIGNRMTSTKNMPLIRMVTNRIMSWFISLVARQYIPDTQCGFRLIKKEVLEKLKLATRKYETESELLIKASRLGFKIDSLPIRTVYSVNEKSQINPLRDTFRFIRYIIKELWTTKS